LHLDRNAYVEVASNLLAGLGDNTTVLIIETEVVFCKGGDYISLLPKRLVSVVVALTNCAS
jgi:hypothetical protein